MEHDHTTPTPQDDTTEGTTMTDLPPPAPPVRRLRRAPDSPLGGVATGIAQYLDVSPLLVQVAFVASTAIGGFGVLAYIACWFLIPTPSDPETRPVTITSDTTRAVFGVLFAIGAASTSLTFGPGTFEITVIPLLLIAAGFYLLNQREGSNSEPASGAAAAPAAPVSHWANVDPTVTTASPIEPEPPRPPVTSVTLAAAAVAVGLLLTIDQFGPDIPAAAVFGTALTVVGAGLVYGAFRGRARGLVPIGLLLAAGLAISPAVDALTEGGTGTRDFTPVDEADVRSSYDLGAGPLELDLRRVAFTEDHTIDVNVGAGYAEVWLPADVNVAVDSEVAAGYADLFGREVAGLFADGSATRSARAVDPAVPADAEDRPTITLVVDVTFGYVEVHHG